jgi:hypothetical protein
MPDRKASTSQTLSTLLLLAALTIAGAANSKAGIVTCASGPGCLNPTDSFDWAANFGAEFNPVPDGSTALSNSGALAAAITFGGGGDGQLMVQGSGWNGNFNPGDAVLWTNSPGQGPITFTFSQPVNAVGAQMQADFFGPFTAELEAFDIHGNLIDSVTASGNSNSNGDGSALFLGLANDAGIASAEFLQISCPCDTADFAIGSLNVASDVSSVPEPGSFTSLFIIFGLAAVARVLRRKPANQ